MRMKATWLPVIAAPVLMLGIMTAAPGAAAAKGVINNPNWAGYAAVVKPGGAVTSFKLVQATFTVPALNCTSTPNGDAWQLVTLGGQNNPNNPNNQAYLQESCKNGSPSYAAFGDSGCNGHGGQAPLTISPGDTVKLVVSGNALISVYDLTTNESAVGFVQSTTCGDNPIAGVLTSGSQNVADFTQVGFRQIQVQGSSQKSPRPLASSAWNLAHYVLRGPSGRTDIKPEALLSGTYTSAFANDWLSPN